MKNAMSALRRKSICVNTKRKFILIETVNFVVNLRFEKYFKYYDLVLWVRPHFF